MQAFLATTGLQSFWADELQSNTFLGPGCLFPARLRDLSKLQLKILDSPWSDSSEFEAGYRYVDLLVPKLFDHLRKVLGKALYLERSERYWKIVLWTWLHRYTSELYDRFVTIEKAISFFDGKFETVLVDSQFRPSIPLDRWNRTHLKELDVYSRIIEALGFEFPKKAFVPERFDDFLITGCGGNRFNESTQIPVLSGHDESLLVGFVGNYPSEIIDLIGQLGFGTMDCNSFKFEACASSLVEDYSMARMELCSFDAEDSFQRLLSSFWCYDLPKSFLEEFLLLQQAVASLDKLPDAVISFLGCQESFKFRLIAAEAAEAGKTIICGQHAATYGLYRHLPSREFEREVSDCYLSWGWDEGSEGKNVPSVQSSYLREQKLANSGKIVPRTAGQRRVIYLANQILSYFREFRSSLWGGGINDYLLAQQVFFEEFQEEKHSEVMFRAKSVEDAMCFQAWLANFPELEFDLSNKPFEEVISDYDLSVCDCSTQVYVDSMVTVPTILLWDPSIWKASAIAEPYLKSLKEAKVLHEDSRSAAKFVDEIWDSPLQWWMQPEVQQSVQRFIDKFAACDSQWRKSWRKALKDAIKEEHAC